MTDEEINAAYPERLTLGANIEKLKRNRVFMAQNVRDAYHYERHFKPFARCVMNDPELEPSGGIWETPGGSFTFWVYSKPQRTRSGIGRRDGARHT